MFNTVTLRGQRGAIVWGSATVAADAATLSSWVVARDKDRAWSLSARVERADSYRLRQVPLLFTAPRVSKPAGLWCFPIVPTSVAITGGSLTAKLGPPEGR